MTSVHTGRSHFFSARLIQEGDRQKEFDEIIQKKGCPAWARPSGARTMAPFGASWRKEKHGKPSQTTRRRGIPYDSCHFLILLANPGGRAARRREDNGITYILYDNTFAIHREIVPYPPKVWLKGNQGAGVGELLMTVVDFEKRSQPLSGDQEGGLTTAKVIELRLTKKSIYRAAARAINKMYQLSAGGSDPLIDDAPGGRLKEVK